MFRLDGMKALVTGALGGIGSGIVKTLVKQGAQVALSGSTVHKDLLQNLYSEIGESHFLQCDLKDSEAAAGLVERCAEALGGIDILINNAGITRDQLAIRMKDEDWAQVLSVNLDAAFRLSRSAIKLMMKARFGRIINITSIVGVTGNLGQANYAASKAGLIGMSKSMAQEVASRGITINCIAPGFIISPMTDALSEEQKKKLIEKIPSGQLGKTEDVAACAAFLASREASYVTGQTLHVNGGMAMV